MAPTWAVPGTFRFTAIIFISKQISMLFQFENFVGVEFNLELNCNSSDISQIMYQRLEGVDNHGGKHSSRQKFCKLSIAPQNGNYDYVIVITSTLCSPQIL